MHCSPKLKLCENMHSLMLQDIDMSVLSFATSMTFTSGAEQSESRMQSDIVLHQLLLLHSTKSATDGMPQIHLYGLAVVSFLLGVPDFMPKMLNPCFKPVPSNSFL